MTDHKKDIYRLLVFLILAFAFAWVPQCIFFGGNVYDLSDGGTSFVLSLSMLAPALAVLITRFVTKEGFTSTKENSLMLGISFKDKKWLWFLAAFIVPWIYRELGGWLFIAIKPEVFDADLIRETGYTTTMVMLMPLYSIINAGIYSFGGFGEEFGWRGYMMPKLEKLMGIGPAVIVGGIIWGVWHYPITYYGHNFGTGYWGEPWLGCLIFTIFTVLTNATFTLVAKKTGSVWAAAFMHAANNGVVTISSYFMNGTVLTGYWAESTVQSVVLLGPSMVVGVISFIWLLKLSKKDKASGHKGDIENTLRLKEMN